MIKRMTERLLPRTDTRSPYEKLSDRVKDNKNIATTAVVLAILLAIAYVATTANTYNTANSSLGRLAIIEETPAPVINATCSPITSVGPLPDSGYQTGRCIAYDYIHEIMYVWYTESPHKMYPLNAGTLQGNVVPSITFGLELDIVPTAASASQSISACGFFEDKFLVIGGTAIEINYVQVEGFIATYTQVKPYVVPGALKGFAIVNRTRYFASLIQSKILYEFNPVTGDVINDTIPFTFSDTGDPAKVFGMSWDPITEKVYCIHDDTGPSVRRIGLLDIDTGIVTKAEGCPEFPDGFWSAMQFDNYGHLWLLYGDNGITSGDIGVYYMNKAPPF